MTVSLTPATADFLHAINCANGQRAFRILAAELTAPDKHRRMHDLGACEMPGTLGGRKVPAPAWEPIERSVSVELAEQIKQLELR
jgi:hypothetical protein